MNTMNMLEHFLRRVLNRPVANRPRWAKPVRSPPIKNDGRCRRQLFEERGWRINGRRLHGHYRTKLGSVRGWIDKPWSVEPDFYITEPPTELLRGPHAACFRQRGKDTFWVHFSPAPRDVNTGIMRIEHCILEALSCRQ